MFKKLFTVLVLLALTASVSLAQWDYAGAFPDTNYKGGTHGIVVTPDGNIWTASYYRSNWVTPAGDTILCAPIFVFQDDGTPVDTIGIIQTGSGFLVETDTLGNGGSTSGCRGMGIDENGNVIYVSSAPVEMYKIDYQTREGIVSHDPIEIGTSPTSPVVDAAGNVYVGPVVGGGTKEISIYDTDLNYLGSAVVGPPNISRTMQVSADGNTIFWPPFTSSPIQMFIYTRPDEFSDYALTDSSLFGMSIESMAWDPVSGNLWVSSDSRGDSVWSHLTWYEYEVSTKALVDSFTLPSPDPVPVDELCRGIALSNDGNVAYVGLFGSKYNRLYKFDKVTGIAQEFGAVVDSYELSQNYPNPFNPTTNITFTLPEASSVSLKVYDAIGQEVATLVNSEMSAGKFTVQFDAGNLASGTYVYELRAGSNVITNKMMLMK